MDAAWKVIEEMGCDWCEHQCWVREGCGCADMIQAALKRERCDGIIAGLEMAEKFLSLTKSRGDVESMIRAAKLTAQEQ